MADRREAQRVARRWERWSAASGIVFAVLAVLWAVTLDFPNPDDSDQQIASFYADSDNRDQLALAGIFLALAGPFLLWFTGTLRSILRRAEGETGRLAGISFAGGVVLAALLFVKNALISATGAVWYDDDFETAPEIARVISNSLSWFVWQEALASAVLIGAASILALRTGVLARWQAWVGVVIAVLCLFTPFLFGLPLILVLAWILVVSILILTRREAEDEAGAVAAPG